ncbi:zeta toxin family protein [Streptomyces sp. NPDC050147]|uniref:zeta toxin family protein n=1 Tax=Streptomyces sp. NPDC050147 TaxID=3155513 RepID=UPI00341AC4B8
MLTRLILPTWTRNAVPQDKPVVVFVAGQPGAGKTRLANVLQLVLNRRGGAVTVGRDFYKSAHQHYGELLEENVRTAGIKVRADTSRWQSAVEEHVRAHRYDTVVESALADADEFRQAATAYRAAGYRIEVVALAVPEALSQLGILERYLGEAEQGSGRYVAWGNHDHCAAQLPQVLAAVEHEQLCDRLLVVRRGLEVVYENELTHRRWLREPAARQALLAERARPWDAQETARFRSDVAQADRRAHYGPIPEDKRLAVQRDAERVAALAEPVRRIAQACSQAPGVDYYRLTHDEHRWIFDELIVPSYFGSITAQERPVVVYVMGQPGAGKTRLAHMVRRTLRGKPARIVGDDFKSNHPDYGKLLREDPRTASSRIRGDYQAWQTQAEAYVRARRGDVVIEIAPGSADQFLESARPFHAAGYRVELVVLAVRAADSRQGTAARYAEVSRLSGGSGGRFTSASGHDVCFAVLPEAVRAAEESGAVDSVVVMHRGATALYRNERTPAGSWSRTPAAVWALHAERQRPYTHEEGHRFLARQRQLQAALPQHRGELKQIMWLAQPLMPAELQPQRLTASAPVAALPMRLAEPLYSPARSLKRAS